MKLKARLKKLVRWDYLSWARDRFGARFALKTLPLVLCRLPVPVPVGKHVVYLRAHNSINGQLPADLKVYDEVFRDREYDANVGDPRFIIDVGAHIGCVTALYAMRYPKAKIIAVELDGDNFKMLKRNTSAFPNVVPIHAALWSHSNAGMRIENPGADTWSYRAAEGGDIRGMTVHEIMAAYRADAVDLLKVDIEGNEKDVLEHSAPWMHKVKAMVIELHERHKAGVEAAFEIAIAGHNFTRARKRTGDVVVEFLVRR